MKTKDSRVQCDRCNKKADYNLQNIWKLYTCNKDGSYSDDREWEGDSNEHFCEKHYKLEVGI